MDLGHVLTETYCFHGNCSIYVWDRKLESLRISRMRMSAPGCCASVCGIVNLDMASRAQIATGKREIVG